MSIRSRLFALSMPRFLRRVFIARLARLTASAFDAEAPRASSLSSYEAFTAEQAEGAAGNSAERLFSSAHDLGSRLRALLGIRRTDEALAVMRVLYRVIGVDFRCTEEVFVVSRCGFSSTYTPQVCRLISSLDAGLLSGLTNGKSMVFTQRITEGAAFCRGVLE
jgi:hypothetical protein